MMETQTSQIDYGKSINELLDSMDKEILPYEEPEKIGFQTTIGKPSDSYRPIELSEAAKPSSTGSVEEDNIINNIPELADMIVWGIDMLGGAGLNYFAKSSERTEFRLDQEEKKQFTKAWKQYLKHTPDFKMSPSTVLLTTTLIIYAPKIVTAVAKRREVSERERDLRNEQPER